MTTRSWQAPGTSAHACPECGAPLPDAGECWARLSELLGIESTLLARGNLEETGRKAHFFAVAAYQLQHPSRSTAEALGWLRSAVERMLRDPVPTERLLRDNARALRGTRIARAGAPGDRGHVDPRWPRTWSTTAVDVIRSGEESYVEGVAQWAAATLRELESSCPRDAR